MIRGYPELPLRLCPVPHTTTNEPDESNPQLPMTLSPYHPMTFIRDYTFGLRSIAASIPHQLFPEQSESIMSTTEKAIDLDSIRQRLDRLGVRL